MNKRHRMIVTPVAVLLMGLALPVSSAVAQQMGLFPVRVAPYGSFPGTPGSPVAVQFNAALDCWELPVLSGGAEVHLEVQVFGWGDASGSPELGVFQATADPTGYSNGIGADLNPKGWPANPERGYYTTSCFCSETEVPCGPPFSATCDLGSAGDCEQDPDFLVIRDPPIVCPNSGISGPVTVSLGYAWASLFLSDPLVDEGRLTTVAGLILEVPPDAAGTYVVGLDPNPNLSFMAPPSGAHIPGLQFIRTCITIVEERPCCLPDGSCTQLLPEDCVIGGGIVACECRGDDDANGVNDACEADCDGDATFDIVEFADCPPGDLSCADCNGNCEPDGCEPDADSDGVPDECDNCPDAPNPGQEDKNGDRLGDACAGACCFVLSSGLFSCVNATEAYCTALPDVSGALQEFGTVCPTEAVRPQFYRATESFHLVWSAQVCGGGHPPAECLPGDPIDPWESPRELATIYFTFDAGTSPPIPADFFGPGSDPWPEPDRGHTDGRIPLEAEPLGPTEWGEFGEAHMLVRRTGGPVGTGDPFDRCEMPSAEEVTVNAEVVALSLVSIVPIEVTFNGGQNPESWDVVVDLSEVTPPPGSITAVKTHCNGGTYNTELNVQPRFTFSEVGGSGTAVLDTGLVEDFPFVTLTQDGDPHWTSDVSETLGLPSPICTDFHPGIEDTEPIVECDSNDNQFHDACEFESPSVALPPHDILKNRYISIDPRGESGINPDAHHIRVTVDSSEVEGLLGSGLWWANPPVTGQPPSPATCISIVTATKPESEPDWSGCPTVHLTGCPIIPTTTYAIAAEVDGNLSADALFDTQAKPGVKWLGDVVGMFTGPEGDPPNVWTGPNGTVNIDDAFAAIKTFIDPNASNATHLSVTDIHPVLNGVQMTLLVNINDALIVIKGFQGDTYGEVASPFPDDEIPDLTECP